ncbi:ABC transporter permease subunit [Ornithinimicrobium pratense]|uniref:ABC transporter permease subunit n=1 Tax=Ornithinimicrobium pratense TaxID=2593973 RepID=A0A5J6V280_9MICO|nr:ABC transporter permease subunit [Ornithinimicrobium pratense]QFG67805.1 ABC transporter permease subunit [Ornithinimicrobium pratense]
MTGLVRSELRKFFTTRMWWGLTLAAFLLGAALTALSGWFMIYGSMPTPNGESLSLAEAMDDVSLARMIYTQSISMGYLLTFVMGIIVIGGEYRHKTLTATLLAAPRRGSLILAKVAAVAITSSVIALAHLAGSVLAGAVLLGSAGHEIFPDAGQLGWVFLRVILVLVLWGLIGLGLGVLIPNQVVALFVGVAIVWIVEPLMGVFIQLATWGETLASYLPAQVSLATVDAYSGMPEETRQMFGVSGTTLTWWVAALVLAGYAAVMTAVGWSLTRRRDVS